MGKTKPKKLGRVKESKKKFHYLAGKKRANPHEREKCTLNAKVIIKEMQEHCTLFDMFLKVTNLDEPLSLIPLQNGREIQTNANNMMVF